MKTICDETLTFITPTFISGADQNVPEVRASSVRGAWRWWFRALDGSLDEEREVFGGVHEGTTASAVVVRVKMLEQKFGDDIRFSPTSDKGYVYFFAAKSGNDKGVHRTEACHYLDVGSSFRLLVQLRRELPDELEQKLRKSLEAFLTLGALGLRATRGCGAFVSGHPRTREEFSSYCQTLPSSVLVRLAGDPMDQAVKCQEALAATLRQLRKDSHKSGKDRSAFGFSFGRERESSALKLRPVRVEEGVLPVVVYCDAACDQPSVADFVLAATTAV